MSSSAIEWDPPAASGQFADSPVLQLFVIADFPTMTGSSDVFAPPSDKQTNHWYSFFATADDSSIQVDPSLGNGNRLSLTLAPKRNLSTEHSARCFEFRPNGLTTKKFLECIIEAGYDRYKFVASGQGCRYWVAHVLKLLEQKGYLNSVDVAVDATNVVWDSNGNPVPQNAQSSTEKGSFLR
ncbi:uncharacterized protein K489DRAFT_384565 [Dissoconium aciculare CBS 342.82]|jgi:hypothetical protein|uniref:DUF7770 domain-containing protein n=1 Tax=Dissoconium aciculare CBS 342.82 TaxID=1314786 RepID=A0A6J3LSN9_9PEZI|nr:uncharacterized protein K489DRAFT_384565 [Dissoconium aciculare CBS 342.82]KAF1818648.1 hypothetical protein K489DRAFT_384565 [Dissoconium aciculare CBS 342.82]